MEYDLSQVRDLIRAVQNLVSTRARRPESLYGNENESPLRNEFGEYIAVDVWGVPGGGCKVTIEI